jgi:hypothetical protein
MSDEPYTPEEGQQGQELYEELTDAFRGQVKAAAEKYPRNICTESAVECALISSAIHWINATSYCENAIFPPNDVLREIIKGARDRIRSSLEVWREHREAQQRAKIGPGNGWSGPSG